MGHETSSRAEPPHPPAGEGTETRRDALRGASALAVGVALGTSGTAREPAAADG